MAEPSLNMKMSDLSGRIGSFFGYGYGEDNGDRKWTAFQARKIKDALDSGLRQFYYPPVVPGEAEAYAWSFLRPRATVQMPEGTITSQVDYQFGGIEGRVAIAVADGTGSWEPARVMNEGWVREQLARDPARTGKPEVVAVEAQNSLRADRSAHPNIIWWPKCDRAYVGTFAMYVLPNALTSAAPYALGGMAHAETLVESCLAMAELLGDDSLGPHAAKYMERLAASVSADRRLKNQSYGYNGDTSDRMDFQYRRRDGWNGSVTFNGTQY